MAVLRFVMEEHGVLSVMTFGVSLMLMWPAGS